MFLALKTLIASTSAAAAVTVGFPVFFESSVSYTIGLPLAELAVQA